MSAIQTSGKEKTELKNMSIGLILEGGGNRGAYTAGVLDVLSENNIFVPVTYAVSAGACNAMSYLSKQTKRNYRIFTEYAADKRYSSFRNLRKTGSLFGFDFIFGELANELLPYDYKEFNRTSMKLIAVATDCQTGKPVFFDNEDIKESLKPLIASASLPMIANIVEYKGYKLLDGGVSASIPIEYAIKQGVTKNIVVLTRDKSYIKEDKPDFPEFILKKKYKDYPALVDAILNRAKIYNAERELCYREQEKGSAIVIEPSQPINIKRQCKDSSEMERLYKLGYDDAHKKLVDINRFIALNSG